MKNKNRRTSWGIGRENVALGIVSVLWRKVFSFYVKDEIKRQVHIYRAGNAFMLTF